jgi:hypothetical protein
MTTQCIANIHYGTAKTKTAIFAVKAISPTNMRAAYRRARQVENDFAYRMKNIYRDIVGHDNDTGPGPCAKVLQKTFGGKIQVIVPGALGEANKELDPLTQTIKTHCQDSAVNLCSRFCDPSVSLLLVVATKLRTSPGYRNEELLLLKLLLLLLLLLLLTTLIGCSLDCNQLSELTSTWWIPSCHGNSTLLFTLNCLLRTSLENSASCKWE